MSELVHHLQGMLDRNQFEEAIAHVDGLISHAESEGKSELAVVAKVTQLAGRLQGSPVGAFCEHYLIFTQFQKKGFGIRLGRQLQQFTSAYPESELPIQLHILIANEMEENGQLDVARAIMRGAVQVNRDHQFVGLLEEHLIALESKFQKQQKNRQLLVHRTSPVPAQKVNQSKLRVSGAKRSLTSPNSKYATLIGKRMNVSGRTQDGSSLRSHQGSWTVVHFWATWCPTCYRRVPGLKQIRDRYAESGVRLVGVNLDVDRRELNRYLRTHTIDWPQIVSRAGSWDAPMARKYGIHSIPATFLVAPDGKVAEAGLGGVASVARVLDYHLAPNSNVGS